MSYSRVLPTELTANDRFGATRAFAAYRNSYIHLSGS